MKKKVLICEDDQGILDVVKIILVNEGFTVLPADRKETIHKFIAEDKPDVILLDIWISGSDGAEIAKGKARYMTIAFVLSFGWMVWCQFFPSFYAAPLLWFYWLMLPLILVSTASLGAITDG